MLRNGSFLTVFPLAFFPFSGFLPGGNLGTAALLTPVLTGSSSRVQRVDRCLSMFCMHPGAGLSLWPLCGGRQRVSCVFLCFLGLVMGGDYLFSPLRSFVFFYYSVGVIALRSSRRKQKSEAEITYPPLTEAARLRQAARFRSPNPTASHPPTGATTAEGEKTVNSLNPINELLKLK